MQYHVTIIILLFATFVLIKTVQPFNDEFRAIFLRGTLFPFPLPTHSTYRGPPCCEIPSLSAVPFSALDCLCQVRSSERENHASLPLRPHIRRDVKPVNRDNPAGRAKDILFGFG